MILLDTHVVLWLVIAPERLSRVSSSAIRRARTGDGIALAEITLTGTSNPSDRLIGATARAEGIPLVTRDESIRSSSRLKTVW
jgi:PIN domain nuclease of toxin-antitoxin system